MHFACLREVAMETFDFASLPTQQHVALLRAMVQRDTLALALRNCPAITDDMLKAQLPEMPFLLSLYVSHVKSAGRRWAVLRRAKQGRASALSGGVCLDLVKDTVGLVRRSGGFGTPSRSRPGSGLVTLASNEVILLSQRARIPAVQPAACSASQAHVCPTNPAASRY